MRAWPNQRFNSTLGVMKSIEPQPERRISEREFAVLSAALERAPRRPEASALLPSVSSLQVVGQCQCGCGSVSFSSTSTQEHPFIVADAVADNTHGLVIPPLIS